MAAEAAHLGHPARVAVDGITAAGKTTLADELAAALGERARRLSLDGYHHPRARRHRMGRESGDGYYLDAYDHDAVAASVLRPLEGPGPWSFLPAIHDLATDQAMEPAPVEVRRDSVLVVDGTFLQRPPLAGLWDVVIWIDVPYELAAARAAVRDLALFGDESAVLEMYERRYHAACRRYVAERNPALTAAIRWDNTDPAKPEVVFTPR